MHMSHTHRDTDHILTVRPNLMKHFIITLIIFTSSLTIFSQQIEYDTQVDYANLTNSDEGS